MPRFVRIVCMYSVRLRLDLMHFSQHELYCVFGVHMQTGTEYSSVVNDEGQREVHRLPLALFRVPSNAGLLIQRRLKL